MEQIREYSQQISALKLKLATSDYKILKYLEGELSEEEYKTICESRKNWRIEINRIQAIIKELIQK